MYQRTLSLSLFALFIIGLTITPASAYLDPGTGTMLFQALIAVLMGLGLTVKIYWEKIKNRLTGNKTK